MLTKANQDRGLRFTDAAKFNPLKLPSVNILEYKSLKHGFIKVTEQKFYLVICLLFKSAKKSLNGFSQVHN